MLKKLKKDIDAELRSFLEDAKPVLAPDAAGGLLYGGVRNFAQRDGKRIRPLLMLISYLGYTKKRSFSRKKLLRSSLSLELMHDFFLVHDDVIDNSALRRGKPTLHRVFNKKLGMAPGNKLGPDLAIAAGDVIFALAIRALFSSDEPPSRKEKALAEFISAAASTGTGEFLDVVTGVKKIDRITEKDVLLTYTLKTAKYTFECPLLVGAILAGAEKKELKKLSGMGIALGQAFQLRDDLLDIFSTSKKIGKPVLSDLDESKKTLLVWKTYRSLSGKDRKQLKDLLEKKKKSYGDLLKFRKLIKKTGAGEYCMEKAGSLLEEANTLLEGLRMKKKYRDALRNLIDSVFSKI